LSSLTAIFGGSEAKSQVSDKLMDLYWNRAELKKEFSGMRQEQFRLHDEIKQQQGATARLQQKIGHIEELLINPQWAHNVVVFYQLRGLGLQCERKLAKFAEQLKQQREQKRHKSLLADWNKQLEQESSVVKLKLREQYDSVTGLEDRLQSEQHRLISMSAFTRLFRGRAAMKVIDTLASQYEVALQQARTLEDTINEIRNRQPPEHQGLDIPAKRLINLMILSFAQQLYIHYSESGIAEQVKEATEKSVGAINYGSRFECSELLSRIDASTEKIDKSPDLADTLQKRAKILGDVAKFPTDTDAVPLADTVSTVFRIDATGMVGESDTDILGDNYWGISTVFSR
jgi:hypothetical protein